MDPNQQFSVLALDEEVNAEIAVNADGTCWMDYTYIEPQTEVEAQATAEQFGGTVVSLAEARRRAGRDID